MDRCTLEQTRKAISLGAPIKEFCGLVPTAYIDGIIYDIPTAEQMKGWIKNQGLTFDIKSSRGEQVTICVWDNHKKELVYVYIGDCLKEATLDAIDAALEYLVKTKEEE